MKSYLKNRIRELEVKKRKSEEKLKENELDIMKEEKEEKITSYIFEMECRRIDNYEGQIIELHRAIMYLELINETKKGDDDDD